MTKRKQIKKNKRIKARRKLIRLKRQGYGIGALGKPATGATPPKAIQ